MRTATILLWAALLSQAQPEDGFAPAESCALCHSRIGAVGQYPLWAGSMKAHAAVDPYWKAQVAFEKTRAGADGAAIDRKCSPCHAPAARLAAEGVTCTACHRIEAGGVLRFNREGEIYGPHARPFTMPMLRHTGYLAVESRHMLDPALCGACHTLDTGTVLEQAPYLEWLASAYPGDGRSCQSCHLPALAGPEYIAHRPPGGPFPPTRPRQPFGRHLFAGGNTHVPRMMAREFPEEPALLEGTVRRAREMLAGAASLSGTAALDGGRLRVRIEVVNRTGHKLPTAHPSRRLWLRVRVTGADGAPVFESGAGEAPDGQPHYRRIDRPEQVMVWEARLGDAAGQPTASLLAAASYLKDNRILPRGFDPRKGARIAPAGVGQDGDFRPGSDTVEYDIAARGQRGPFRILAEAWYQSIRPESARALGPAFVQLHRDTGPGAVAIARVEFSAAPE